VAVCVLPGTELSFADTVTCIPRLLSWRDKVINHKTAIFRQINKDRAAAHHVALEFPDGQIVLLTLLCEGQLATVLQLPAEPKAATETELAFERRKIETEAKLKPARLARTRLLDFRPRRRDEYQCPFCWLQNETQSTLNSVPSVTSDEILRCDACGSEYVIPAAAS
jgi:hypothetical protein